MLSPTRKELATTMASWAWFFFFQAEDGIRDLTVTGVQTCALPICVRRPYFLFGDEQQPVELWFVDLAAPDRAELWEGRGSGSLEPGEGETPEVRASFADGKWAVIYKRKRNAGSGITFPEDSFVPLTFSVWDGFDRD